MRILIQAGKPTICQGWVNALKAAGHEVFFLGNPFDSFDSVRPAIYIESGHRTRAIEKCLAERPRTKVVSLEHFQPAFDHLTYKQGGFDESLACQVCFVGDYRSEREKYIYSVLGEFDVKLFGPTPWGIPQYRGWIEPERLGSLYRMASVCLDISTKQYSERYYQIRGLGGIVVNSAIPLPQFISSIKYFLSENMESVREENIKWGLQQTYLHRVKEMFNKLNMEREAERCSRVISSV